MDLAKANPRIIASLIVNGRRQLDEVPRSARHAVASCVEDIKREREKPKAEFVAEAPLEAPTINNLKSEIMEALDAFGIEYSTSSTKSELLALFPI